MRVLAQGIPGYRSIGRAKRELVAAGLDLQLGEPDHGIERHAFQPLALSREPVTPGLLRNFKAIQ